VLALPMLDAGQWPTPASRDVAAARRLQARLDEDVLLGPGEASPLSLVVHHETDLQKGVNADDLAALAAGSDTKRDQLRALATRYGEMLARAHGQALTADGTQGVVVIAPLIEGQTSAFVDEIATFAVGDVAQIEADYASMQGRDLASLVLPLVAP
jgi:hypothetical protein